VLLFVNAAQAKVLTGRDDAEQAAHALNLIGARPVL
jgi:hypothetical protein